MLLAGLAALLPASPLRAQGLPQCGQETNGLVACIEQTLCTCGYVRGGTMTGEPSGFKWDCGATRPLCPPEQSILPYHGSLPESVGLDRSNTYYDDRSYQDDRTYQDQRIYQNDYPPKDHHDYPPHSKGRSRLRER